jgi:hypothetical protein
LDCKIPKTRNLAKDLELELGLQNTQKKELVQRLSTGVWIAKLLPKRRLEKEAITRAWIANCNKRRNWAKDIALELGLQKSQEEEIW